MGFSITFSDFFKQTVPSKASQPAMSPTQELFELKKRLLIQAAEKARTDGRVATLEDYRLACVHYGQSNDGMAMTERGEWGPKIYADLRGQHLTGFLIADFSTSRLVVTEATHA